MSHVIRSELLGFGVGLVYDWVMQNMNHNPCVWKRLAFLALCVTSMGVLNACELQQRRVDVKQASGADEGIDDRFGLTADAQDPTERDKELGYGKWKAKPEPEGTASPTNPSRRGSSWGSVDN